MKTHEDIFNKKRSQQHINAYRSSVEQITPYQQMQTRCCS